MNVGGLVQSLLKSCEEDSAVVLTLLNGKVQVYSLSKTLLQEKTGRGGRPLLLVEGILGDVVEASLSKDSERAERLRMLAEAGSTRSEAARIMGVSKPRITQLSQMYGILFDNTREEDDL